MNIWISITLGLAVALTGVPHAFCACGCGGLVALIPTEASDRVCHSCTGRDSVPAPDGQRPPCECQSCGVIQALATAPATTVPYAGDVRSVGAPQASFLVAAPAPAPSPGSYGGTEPPGHFTGSQCALTILLGHLLL